MDSANTENLNPQMHKLLQDLAHFIALYERTEDRLKAQKEGIEQQIDSFKKEMELQINNIQTKMHDFNEVMSAAGAARWRIAAEEAMKQGEGHLKSIKEATDIYKQLADDSINRLEKVAVHTEQRINKALMQIQNDNSSVVEVFRNKTEETYNRLNTFAKETIENIRRLLRWLKWDRAFIAIIAALLASLLTSLYVNAEWPWETHAKSRQERNIGKTLLTVWPSLSNAQQNELNKILGRKI